MLVGRRDRRKEKANTAKKACGAGQGDLGRSYIWKGAQIPHLQNNGVWIENLSGIF